MRGKGTASKQAIEPCDMQAEVYESILRSLSEAVCAVDSQWRIRCLNRQAQRLTGVSLQNAIGVPLANVFSADAGELHSLIASVMESGEIIHGTRTHIVNSYGESISVIANAAPVLDSTATISGVVVILHDNRDIEILRRELRDKYTFGDIVTKDERICRILDILPSVAESDSTILVLGPTGTGKELLARAIHSTSGRRDAPFVAVNCGALPEALLESELFGYKKGAFTDAKQDKRGRFALAEGGTLLLDEIGDVPAAMQVKLLRVLEEGKYEPLGGTESVNANVRIVAATNRDLQKMVEAKEFRADLYYRLNVIEFSLPPLFDRPEDIPLLLDHFVEVLNAETGRGVKRISHTAMGWLMRYSYPGNVRELRNILEHAYVLCPGEEIRDDCLPPRVLSFSRSSEPAFQPAAMPLRRMPPKEQREMILRALYGHNGHRKRTADALGIDKSTLWRKMKSFGIEWIST